MERCDLTPRELEVVRLLSQGCSYARIADRLGISEHTVTSHIKNVYRKLDVHTAAAAVFRAFTIFGEQIAARGSPEHGMGATQAVA